MSYEMSYAMPDKKTVYGTQTMGPIPNEMFHRFVATTAGDISEGVDYCAKITQTSADDCEAIDFTAKVEWLAMSTPSAQVQAAIKTETFSSLFRLRGVQRRRFLPQRWVQGDPHRQGL